jgi:hypothetical protein
MGHHCVIEDCYFKSVHFVYLHLADKYNLLLTGPVSCTSVEFFRASSNSLQCLVMDK